ncbi:protein-L-isoaspartate(D-aspartate) O-methyltransferase [Citreimonas salinaria]|uniref:Protein-L-isoaspartate O-methyltransferase n=1 Tax=Citreimonas salinaria TaxID=321339 RepID=A0A1H3NXE6_9RHOB|nr:protein-L-isoaspartate(D-aspartate) O-methyltransferase [Citreimonas salinaria]SDY93488.1 protein-L-isoaspartate(D-aspartate) O-methyltransferase [Citreimonas salinaria]
MTNKKRWFAALALSICATLPAAAQDRAEERANMVETVQAHALSAPSVEAGVDPVVLEVMRAVPRHEFVPPDVRLLAYEDRPLPIGYGQTISQPFIVALMTDLLKIEPGDKVLEVGTGSGYQAAVLSPLAEEVYTIEIVPELGERAAGTFADLGFENVEAKIADGYYGWPEQAPFDAIVVTAAASQIPPPLVQQLKPGGRMVIPIGGPFSAQQLMLVEKQEDGSITSRQLLPVQFVPFTRAEQ